MELIQRICILLLINVATGSSDEEYSQACLKEYLNQHECYRRIPNGNRLFREINSTTQTNTGSEENLDTIRWISRRYCVSGYMYVQCLDALLLTPECQDTESLPIADQIFVDKIVKFAIEYVCRNDAEAVFKITANNGLKTIMNMETAEVLKICTTKDGRSDYNSSMSETFCKNVDVVSECILEYSDQMANQDISSIIRDIIPQLKVIGKCATVVEPQGGN